MNHHLIPAIHNSTNLPPKPLQENNMAIKWPEAAQGAVTK
jgi:hypothetical protein